MGNIKPGAVQWVGPADNIIHSYTNYIDKSLIKFDDIKRNPIYVNLLHFDENLTTEENQNYYKYFKLNIVGGYFGINDFNRFKKLINAIQCSKVFVRYVLVVSGSKSMDVLNYCGKCKFIDDIIIFCNNTYLYNNLKKNYKINIVTNSFLDIVQYLNNKSYTMPELDMSIQIPITPLITFFEYKYCYFAIHRMISRFFKDNWANPSLTEGDVKAVIAYLNRTNFDINMKNKIISILYKLCHSKNFTLDCIRYYTGEDLCYIFNKTLRDIGKNFDGMSHFVGPFNYALYKFLKDNPNKGIWRDATLYRDVKMNDFDLSLYYLSYNDVICLPSFTSTTLSKTLNFESTKNAKIINNTSQYDYPVKMVFRYKYKQGNISPGILIMNESQISDEFEVILFPFTFVKISGIQNKGNGYMITFDIINRTAILEYELKRNRSIDLDPFNNRLIIK